MTLTRNRFIKIYKLTHGYLGVINIGNKEYQFGIKLTKPRFFKIKTINKENR